MNSWSRPGIATSDITGIVVHYTANPGVTAKQHRDYFENLGTTQETRASSNFIIGLDGEVIICVPLGEVAYASNSRNLDTISVEFCHADESGALGEATYSSLVKLTRWLMNRYSLNADAVIRHYDIPPGKICPKYFVDHPEAWETFLNDIQKSGGEKYE